MKNVSYSNPVPPADYKCCRCQVTGVKLWRDYEASPPIELFCAVCAANDQKKSIADIDTEGKRTGDSGDRTDQIGWYVPAVPDEEGLGYWGYTSVPQAGVDWWRALPTLSELKV